MGKSLKGKELGKGIRQRKDKRYEARYTNRFGQTISLYADTYSEITDKLVKDKYEDSKMLNVIDNSMTLDEWFDVWMTTYKQDCRNTTIEMYTYTYLKLKPLIGWRKMSTFNLIILQQALNKLSNDNSRRTAKRVLNDIFNKALQSDVVTKNYVPNLKTDIIKSDKKERKVLTVKEEKIFREYLNTDKYKSTQTYKDIYILALDTGMRIGEVLGLQWEDVDIRNKKIYVSNTLVYLKPVFNTENHEVKKELHKPKTASGYRTIPMSTEVYNLFLGMKKSEQGFVFTTKKGEPLNPGTIRANMKVLIGHMQEDYPDFEYFSFHTFRHTFATRAIEMGVKPKTLQKILGHAKISITMDLYCHTTDDSIVEAFKIMDKYMV